MGHSTFTSNSLYLRLGWGRLGCCCVVNLPPCLLTLLAYFIKSLFRIW